MKKIFLYIFFISCLFLQNTDAAHKTFGIYEGKNVTIPDNTSTKFLCVSGNYDTSIQFGGQVIVSYSITSDDDPQSGTFSFLWTGGGYQGIVTAGVATTPIVMPASQPISGTVTVSNISMADEGSGKISFSVTIDSDQTNPSIKIRVHAIKNFGENFFYDGPNC